MRFSAHAVLLAAFALLAIGSSFGSAESNSFNTQVVRSLRVTETSNVAAATTDAEDRGFPQFVLAHLKNKVKDARIKTWLMLGKSDEQVMNTLGTQQGLTRAQLRDHPKFKIFERFQVKKWLKEGTSPSQIWSDLGLKIFAGDVMTAPGYTIYVEYVWGLGAKVFKCRKNGGTPPTIHKIVDQEERIHTVIILTIQPIARG